MWKMEKKKPKVSTHCEGLAQRLYDFWVGVGYLQYPSKDSLESRIKAYFLDNDLVIIRRDALLSGQEDEG